MTPEAGRRAPFELLTFTAAPVAGALVVIELEGRFAAQSNGRFIRRPVLVIEADDRPRLELAPVRAELHDAYWHGAYAIPAEALADAHFALGLRGTLLELPAPDEADDTAHLATLAREANSLRRALEAAEAEAVTARAEADAASAEIGAAVLAARDGALTESSDRIAALEAELAEVRRTADAARADAIAETAAGHEQALAELTTRTLAAEQAAQAAAAGTDVLRAELAEERAHAHTAVTEPTPIAPVSPPTTTTTTRRGPGPWIAVAALVLFAVVLLVLLLG